MGYSTKISDPSFNKYLVNSNRWSAIFSCVLAVIAIAGFFIYGETSSEMDNPQALFIGHGNRKHVYINSCISSSFKKYD